MLESVKFQEPVESVGAGGVVSIDWTDRHHAIAKMIYHRGSEAVAAARLEGRPIYKIKIRSCAAARAITTDYRMTDRRRADAVYAVLEIDAITDPKWVYLVVEGGKAS